MPSLIEPLTLRGLTLPHRIVVSPMCQVLERRRLRHRLAPGAPRVARRRRRGAGHHRGDGRHRRGAHQPGRPRHLVRRSRRAAGAHRPLRRTSTARVPASSSPTPDARAARAVPWHGEGAVSEPDGRLAAGRPGRRAVLAELSGATARSTARASPRSCGVRRRGDAERATPGSTSSRSTRRTATCCTSSCRRWSTRATDEYGGSFENRIRLCLEVIDAVRGVWPEQLPVWLRISATDWVEGGWDIEQSVELARAARAARRGPDRLLVRRRRAGADPGRTRLSGAVRRAHPPRGRRRDRRGRADHRSAAGRCRSSARARPTACCWRASCCATRTGRCMRPPRWGTRHVAGAVSACRTRSVFRPPAAP